ncbi:NUDIX hydrolase [Streptomyces qinzhouensis]|uniref:NUDIX domain-containing protein n=1 Tax=Streptomyces qinzhouensis TaxID=2599401 RepID=A0A5B8JLG5_9ACTN|nr:NUDIX domain-containing protein [Streptomyces qinzhouensis]QDY81444.1 NUDIX domain-containing protein [Streptomyces qinzhouensis]
MSGQKSANPPASPGGNVEHGEDLDVALARELTEELLLDTALAEGGGLLWVVDQRVTRPGPTPPPRKLHLIYRFHISPGVLATLAEQELDELPDGSHEAGVIEWIDYRRTAELPTVRGARPRSVQTVSQVAACSMPAEHRPLLRRHRRAAQRISQVRGCTGET